MKTPLIILLSLSLPWDMLSGQAVKADPALPAYQPTGPATGEIASIGARNLDTLMESWARVFHQLHPAANIRLNPGAPLSADGFDALLAGRAQLAPFAREASPTEMADFRRKFGYPPLLICVATGSYATKYNTHALGVYVNAANPLTKVTLAQLDAIYSTTRRRGYPEDITTWGQLGLTGEWADRPIHLYGMVHRYEKTNNPPGIWYFFLQRVLRGGEMKATVHEIVDTTPHGRTLMPQAAAEPAGAGEEPVMEALDGIVAAVARDPAGIGYSGFRNRREGAKTLALAVKPAGPFFTGTLEDVLHRDYPLTRKVYIVINRAPGRPLDPLVREFLHFVLSREGQEIVATDPSNYLPLTPRLAAKARAQLD
jgi:phosphate transport system substrate-binding protein